MRVRSATAAGGHGSRGSVSPWKWFLPAGAGQPSRQQAFGRPMPDYDPDDFDLARDLPQAEPARELVNVTDPALADFRQGGGKLIMYHGWADAALNPLMSVEFYQRAVAANSADAPEFCRLFMIPGMFHCRGGNGTDTFDGMTPLIDWVERGIAPDSIQAARMIDGQVTRTHPLCPYPQVAAYDGSGSIDDKTNFSCTTP